LVAQATDDYLMLENCAPPPLNKSSISERADGLLPKFQQAIADMPPEAGFGGIWESEMFLFYAAVSPCAPKQILESGRSRGKSTLTLARCFPEARIISVELDPLSANATAAEAKLRPYQNVELLYGDSREILPQRLRTGDAVLIDGPKNFRALELALQILRTAKACVVFIHDFPANAPWRKFLERHWPGAFFGDDPLFERFRMLDQFRDPRGPTHAQGRRRYGTFACLPPNLPEPYWQLHLRLYLARIVSALRHPPDSAEPK
jgi:predicted O-methyltransferase YrrM